MLGSNFDVYLFLHVMHRCISDGVVTDSSCSCCLPGSILSGLYLCDRMHFIEATVYLSGTSTGHSYTVNMMFNKLSTKKLQILPRQ